MATEKRLIDANEFGMYLADVQLANRGWKDDLCDFLDDVMDALDEQPTVDAVEVVHGEWIDSTVIPGTYMCNKCGKSAVQKHNFCNRCGAKMDGGADNVD